VKQSFFLIIILFIPLNLYSEKNNIEVIKYITSIDGLRVRDAPGLNGNKIGFIPFGTPLIIINESENTEVVNNINAKR